ncbi:zinc carboxypeptidase [Paucibacter sp. KBW04]|uniref:M14 family zinc carboxypeptidase n=1 Tax=Paucibacter sp. KBW04 TaxID=2153361 RepID=UPI000F57FF99|nr:M14 family zinc carboxypeptidase [Paucibacter sp. KBW04]RQO62037.1 zinc carboxypeptidase [Paucibacter sp. KBW04]
MGTDVAVLPELRSLDLLVEQAGCHVQRHHLCDVQAGQAKFPVWSLTLGNPDPAMPAVGFFGGVHGLERIGAELVQAFFASLVSRLRWDSSLHRLLETVRIVFMPLVNPGGLWRGTRANPRGVDLMRNAPVDSSAPTPFLLGGQRLSPRLPWFRGHAGEPMERESQALCDCVREEMLSHQLSLAVDCHSGFGLRDRIWFPFAHTAQPIAHLAEMHAFSEVLDQTHAQHRYVFEPQSRQYQTHGDLWDFLYAEACTKPGRMLLPLTLEMGSWLWIKKNPKQLFSRYGMFNPLIAHRQQRVLRRHLAWLDFVLRAAASMPRWLPLPAQRLEHERRAVARWYRAEALA